MAGQQPEQPAPSSAPAAAQPPPTAARQNVAASVVNKFRVTSVVDRIWQHLNGTSKDNGPSVFYNLCLSLARGMDYAVANKEVPYNPEELPELLKQVCSRKNDCISKSICMVLLLSAKNACNSGWFSEKDAHELLTLTEEMAKNFFSPTDVAIGSKDTLSSVSTIMTRFYPSFKLGQIFTSLYVKPGYGAYISDFHISKDSSYSVKEKIRLLVAQLDNIETSACIINPQQVNFLVNGKAVERRTNCNMDAGPQLPTNVTTMLKYGTNLLQVVGQFNGPCIIIVAFMSVNYEHNRSSLLPYLPPNDTAPDTVPDSDLIEGPSRISLNCPISNSRTRIKLPVKGHSCKHLQCFDFSNFLEINLRRPSWRCPHCNRYVCYTDLRADQTLAKIMEEVAEDIAEVIISADGSWKAVIESNDELSKLPEENLHREKNVNPEVEYTGTVVDLTEINDEMDITPVSESGLDDRKPLDSDRLGNSSPATFDASWWEDSILVRSPSLSPRPSNFGLDVPANSNLPQPNPAGVTPLPLPTHTVSNQDGQGVIGSSYLQALEAQFPYASGGHAPVPMNSNASESGYGNIPALRPRNPTPATTMQPLSQPRTPASAAQGARTMANPSISNAYPNHPSFRPAARLPQQLPILRPSPPQPMTPHRPSAGGLSNFTNAHLQHALNRLPSSLYRTPLHMGRPSLHQRNNPTSIAQASHPAVPNPIHAAGQPSTILPNPSPVHSQYQAPATLNSSRNAAFSDSTPTQDFRPAGRMRGSLSGRPISDGLSDLIIHPTQLARPAGLPAGYSPSNEVSAPPHLQVQNLNPGTGQMNHAQRNH